MRRQLLTIAASLVLCTAAFAQTQPATTQPLLPIPDAAARAKARDMIHNVLKSEYAKTAAADRQALARRLLTEAAATKDDPAARYVLLTDAIDLAASTGDAGLIIQSANDLARSYTVDALELKRAALARAANLDLSPDAAETLSRACLDTAEAATLTDQFETATQLAGLSESTANRSRKIACVAAIQPRLADLRALAAEFTQTRQALATLEKNPNDADAHQSLGRFYALHKGQWSLGLPHLAAGTDDAMRSAATKELANPTDAIDQAALGDAWYDLAQKSTALTRTQLTKHALTWYQRCKPSLTGITLTRIQSRLQEASAPTAATTTVTATTKNGINLLPLIDPAKDKADGAWSLDNNALTVADGKYAALQLPYNLPDEYDLRVTFTRLDGAGPICLLLASHNKSFGFELDVKGEARFERVANKIAKDNPTTVPVAISNNHRYTLTIQIRNDAIKALLDDKPLTQWKTDYKDLSRYPLWKIPNDKLCGLGANSAKVTFHTIELVEITGTGKPIR